MIDAANVKPIVVYVIERHPLDLPETGPLFRWLRVNGDLSRELEPLLGPFNPDQMRVLIDPRPGGEAWSALLQGLMDQEIQTVITHLAPLTGAQRQQLIGICDQVGSTLVTPGDAGRNTRRIHLGH